MPHARSKLYTDAASVPRSVVALGGAARLTSRVPLSPEARRELDDLRSVNAQLLREIAALKRRELQTQKLAERDGLTGLYNRRRMRELLDSMIATGSQHHESVGLLFIDLNRFKSVNDEYGHTVGDKLLTTVGARIAARVRTGDFVCRYGGDEFVVLLPSVPDAAVAAKVANKIRERVNGTYLIDGHELHVSAAIGIAVFPADGVSGDAMLRRADESMYGDKRCSAVAHESRGDAYPARPARRRDDKSKPRAG
jgi:diguanylate cyclase (GGDEF)-like protein